ncbi:hypothetical protein GCM10011343_15420 [Flavobacterium orientale]|uniref:DUF4129 domain-containing protein n=2 Tax=Flavobacterium orientale TaxID=1756020 RepID=A0A916Y1B1_9FLAO|nr:hypothetical protein GCM10011343_15420 [Flavobacterium orientale]
MGFAQNDSLSMAITENKIDTIAIEELQFETGFKEKYSDDAFIYEAKAKKVNAWDRFKESLFDFFERIFNSSSRENTENVVEIILKVLAAALLIFVIYLIVKAIMNGEGTWVFGKSSDKKVINYEEIEKNIHLVDFEKLIKATLKNGENRLAIRYYYLWLLKIMSAKQFIEWDVEKTNSDYLYEINNTAIKNQFEYVSYLYNYIWYGEFELDEVTFIKAKKAFDNLINSLG